MFSGEVTILDDDCALLLRLVTGGLVFFFKGGLPTFFLGSSPDFDAGRFLVALTEACLAVCFVEAADAGDWTPRAGGTLPEELCSCCS